MDLVLLKIELLNGTTVLTVLRPKRRMEYLIRHHSHFIGEAVEIEVLT